jgi:archaeosortase A (PGF-CTERM-specific)
MLELLWISVILMLVCLIIRKNHKIIEILCGAAWILFGVYWISLIPGYYEIGDYVNIVLIILLALFCLLLLIFVSKAYKKTNRLHSKHHDFKKMEKKTDIFFDLTKLVVIVCIIYLPFKVFGPLNHFLIEAVATQTNFLLNMLGYAATHITFDEIVYNNAHVTIILACTAIESIAFFTGLVLTARSDKISKKIAAFLLIVPAIYILNLLRNVFVVIAYGDLWFGANSFEIAHHYIAKAGSGIALVVLASVTLKLLPELTDMILQLYDLITEEVRSLLGKTKKES